MNGLSPDETFRALRAMNVPENKARAQAYGTPLLRDSENMGSVVAAPAAVLELPLRLTLPWSLLVSDDDRTGVLNGRQILTTRYREARRKIQELVRHKIGAVEAVATPLALHARVYVPDNRPHDVPNFAKGVHDAMEKYVYVNDRWLWDARWTRAGVDVDAPRAEIEIRPIVVDLSSRRTTP